MKIYYKILSVDYNEGSMIVRFFTDFLSEQQLSIIPNDPKPVPDRCRTDVNLTLYRNLSTADEFHKFILAGAPIQWF